MKQLKRWMLSRSSWNGSQEQKQGMGKRENSEAGPDIGNGPLLLWSYEGKVLRLAAVKLKLNLRYDSWAQTE